MEVILLERVDNLGQMGDIVSVKDGFARNFLLPRKKALRATEDNKTHFEQQRKEIEAQNLARRKEAEAVATKMDGVGVVLVRQAGESGQLYGSVNARDVADALTEKGFQVERNQIILDKPVKTIGLQKVSVRLHPEVTSGIVINVARSEGEAETQFKTGEAVISETAEPAEEIESVDTEKLVEELVEDRSIVEKVAAEAQRAEDKLDQASDQGEVESTEDSGDDSAGEATEDDQQPAGKDEAKKD